MALKHKSYTDEQAEELDRALQAQYKADKESRSKSSDDERKQWRAVRRASASQVLKASNQTE
jgi:hypothetical protein